MESRFEKAKQYLIDLLQTYGHRPILVKVYQDAVFDFDEAYVEEFCQGKPEAESYISSVYSWIERKKEWMDYTFSYYAEKDFVPFLREKPKPKLKKGDLSVGLNVTEEDVEELKGMGYKQISNIHAMIQVFWNFASYRKTIGKGMKNAILSITVDDEAADYLEMYVHYYNRFIQEKTDSDTWTKDRKTAKEINGLKNMHQAELNALNKKFRTEQIELYTKRKQEMSELRKRHSEELAQYVVMTKEYRALIDNYRKLLRNPYGRINQTYDLTNEKDIRNFIQWYKVLHKKIKNQVVKNIVKVRFKDNPDDAKLFEQMVEEYNSTLPVDAVFDDDEEAEEEV